MQFNWDNPQHIIGHWPTLAGGEFIGRCLSLHKTMVWPCRPNHLDELLQGATIDRRWEILSAYGPNNSWQPGTWHRIFPSSGDWLDISADKYPVVHDPDDSNYRFGAWESDLWSGSKHASREFYDRFWKPKSIEASQTYGLMIKAHNIRQLIGLKSLLPNAKIFKLENYRSWQMHCLKINKAGSDHQTGTIDTRLIEEKMYPGDDLPIYSFDMDRLIGSESSFLTQMAEAYAFFHSPADFHSLSKYLLEYRKLYLSWHVMIKNKNI